MLRSSVRVFMLGLVALLSGCQGDRQEAKEESLARTAQEATLTGEQAKRALLEMDPRQIPAGVLVLPPLDQPIRVEGADEISMGIYRCDLKARTFQASEYFPNAFRHKSNHVKGVFHRNADGKWVAQVTDASSAG